MVLYLNCLPLAICLSDNYLLSTYYIDWGHNRKQDRIGSCPHRTYLLMGETHRKQDAFRLQLVIHRKLLG